MRFRDTIPEHVTHHQEIWFVGTFGEFADAFFGTFMHALSEVPWTSRGSQGMVAFSTGLSGFFGFVGFSPCV